MKMCVELKIEKKISEEEKETLASMTEEEFTSLTKRLNSEEGRENIAEDLECAPEDITEFEVWFETVKNERRR